MAAPQAPQEAMRPGSEGATATECRKCRPEWQAHINRDTRVATHQWIVKRSTGSQSEGLRVFDPEYRSLHPPYEELVAIIRPATPTNKEPRPARHNARSTSAGPHRHVGINRRASAGVSSPALPSAAARPVRRQLGREIAPLPRWRRGQAAHPPSPDPQIGGDRRRATRLRADISRHTFGMGMEL